MDSNVDKADLLFEKRNGSVFEQNELHSRNRPFRDRQNALRFCSERNTCVEHNKSARITLGVIKDAQCYCDTFLNSFRPQTAIDFVFVPEGVPLVIIKCKSSSTPSEISGLSVPRWTTSVAPRPISDVRTMVRHSSSP